jgi:hypothetical protein
MDNDKLDQALKDQLADSAPAEVHACAGTHFQNLAETLRIQPTPAKRPRRPLLWFWAGVSLSGSVALTALAFAFLFSSSPTWAQVAERFRNLSFFNATVFFTESSEQKPEKIDLWVAQDRRLRAHYRGFIFFGAEGRINKVLSADKGDEVPLDEIKFRLRSRDGGNDASPALVLLRGLARLGQKPEFSLDQLLQLVSGKREELRLTPNTDTSTAGDMEVFDFAGKKNPEWMRLWVLKKSELPVRLRIWDPCDGGQTDLLFDYATQMPEDAFDPIKVQAALQEKQGATNRLYTLLPDSGGQPITPEQLFASRGYHLPDVDSIGRTPEGVVWVLSRNVENRRPDGERVFGWSQLTDNLGQEYTHRVIGWMASDDSLLEYFVPAKLGADFKQPGSYQLICNDTPATLSPGNEHAGKSIGTLAITHWRETTTIPDLLRTSQNQIDGRTNWLLVAMDEAAEQQDWTKFEQTAVAIPGNPETDLVALTRDVKLAHILKLTQNQKAAVALCTRLYPLVATGVQQGQPFYSNIVRWHIADLYRSGQRVEARVLANRHALEAFERSKTEGPQFVVDLLIELRLAGLTEAETSSFFENKVINQQSFHRQIEKARLFGEPSPTPTNSKPTAML